MLTLEIQGIAEQRYYNQELEQFQKIKDYGTDIFFFFRCIVIANFKLVFAAKIKGKDHIAICENCTGLD